MGLTDSFCAPEDCAPILAAILDKSDDAVIRADLDGVIMGWSSGAARLYGYTADEAIGASVGMLIPEEKWDEFLRMLDQIRAGASVNHCETIRRTKEGCLVDVMLSILPVTDQSRRTTSVLSIARDLTALRQTEAAYRAGEARWRAIVDSAVDGIIVIDSRGTVETFNAAAERLFGYRADEIVGRSVNLLMPPPYRDEHDRYLETYLAGGPPKIIGTGREVTARRRSGEDFPARLAVAEASVDGETRFTGIVHDLTERVQMEQRLREQAAVAKVGEMAAVVAHEVRNALAAVRGTVQVIGSRFPAESREAGAAGEAVARLDGLTRIVKDILLFAHLPEPQRHPVDLAQLVASTASLAANDPSFAGVGIDIIGTVPPILGDADLLRIVLLNLFTNSAQAMQGTGTIRVLMDTTATSCRIVVADNGPSVPPEVRERLFTPFFTTKARGSGLGLATAKRIVEAHRGDLRVDYPEEGGTRVIVQLPNENTSTV
jgi:two-component system sensor kinase FixL